MEYATESNKTGKQEAQNESIKKESFEIRTAAHFEFGRSD